MSTMTVIRASDVINQARTCCSPILTDEQIAALCPACGPVTLSTCCCLGGAETTYVCRCARVLMVIAAPNADARPWPGRGYRIGDFVLRNAVAIAFDGIRLPASPAALAAEREPEAGSIESPD